MGYSLKSTKFIFQSVAFDSDTSQKHTRRRRSRIKDKDEEHAKVQVVACQIRASFLKKEDKFWLEFRQWNYAPSTSPKNPAVSYQSPRQRA